MGQKISRLWGTLVTRPLQRYNIEHRAEKVIIKTEDPKGIPVRAPLFKADAQFLEQLRTTQPKLAEAAHRKDVKHHSRLRDIYVTSKDPDSVEFMEPEAKFIETKQNPSRPFPLDRKKHYADFVPAAMRLEEKIEPTRGRLTLNMAVGILGKRKAEGMTYSSQAIAEEYKIGPEMAVNLVQYYSVFSMHEPIEREPHAKIDPLEAGKDWVEATINDIENVTKKDEEKKRQLTEGEINELREHEEKLALARNRKRTNKLE